MEDFMDFLVYIVYFIVILTILLFIMKFCLKIYKICGCDIAWINAIIMSMESNNNDTLGNANVHFVNINIDPPPAYSDNFNSDPPAYSDLSDKAFITIVHNNSDPTVYSNQNNIHYSAAQESVSFIVHGHNSDPPAYSDLSDQNNIYYSIQDTNTGAAYENDLDDKSDENEPL